MTIRDLVTAYVLADATVAGLIGTRLYPDMLPQKVTYPAGVIRGIDIVRPGHLRGVAGLGIARMQVDFYAAPASGISSRGLADQCGAAGRQRLDGYAGTFTDSTTSPVTTVRASIRFEIENDGVEEELHGGLSKHSADYFVSYQTQAGLY